jgi:hypothetical protein
MHLKRTTLMKEEKRAIPETLAFATTTPLRSLCHAVVLYHVITPRSLQAIKD